MAKTPNSDLADKSDGLTPKEEAFALAFCNPACKGPSEAYRTAGYSVNGSARAISVSANEILNRPRVAARIVELREAAAAPVIMQAADVLREWITIHSADPSELTRVRRFACRHCYGIDHHYQWINEEEHAIACARVIDANAALAEHKPRARQRPMPECDGGFGYDRDRDPVATCPHCNGDGEVDVYVADTRKVSPAARKLFAGVKTTRDGIEIKTRDQDAALLNIAKYLGMLAERHMHGGDPSNRTPIATLTAEVTPQEAAALYQACMK